MKDINSGATVPLMQGSDMMRRLYEGQKAFLSSILQESKVGMAIEQQEIF
jgi:hypothetical protein